MEMAIGHTAQRDFCWRSIDFNLWGFQIAHVIEEHRVQMAEDAGHRVNFRSRALPFLRDSALIE
jgi:hypothetical protein